jgi:hypothetical protein
MNILEMHDEITRKWAAQAAAMQDSASFAYVTEQMRYLRSTGADLTEYEVIMARDEYPKYTEDGLKINYHIRLVRLDKPPANPQRSEGEA